LSQRFPLSSRNRGKHYTPGVFSLFQVYVEALVVAVGMAVLLLLDFVRVGRENDLLVNLSRPCLTNASLTCPPHTGLC
jgi:hypothetical protein